MIERILRGLLICVVFGFWLVTAASSYGANPSSGSQTHAKASQTLVPLSSRFGTVEVVSVPLDTPDFQRHIGPLLGRLGCNGRACHGSFQGRGGFQLSLFGYDFKADHEALLSKDSGRVDTENVDESLILSKPTDADMHEGGKRMDLGSWQHRVIKSWIAAGAPFSGELQTLENLEVSPSEIIFTKQDENVALKVVAHWADGSSEDVTELCRFTTNDSAVADINEDGLIHSTGHGDTHVVVAYDKAVVPVAIMRPSSIDSSGIAAPRRSNHPIDQLVLNKLNKLRVIPSDLCSDEDFIRRASLDATGMLPSAARVTEFLQDDAPDKRARFIDRLLDEPAYAAWWATRLSDWTGNNEEQLNNYFPVRGVASKYWYVWLQHRLADNVPYDEIVEGLVDAEARMPEESYAQYCETMSEACRTSDGATFAARPGVPQFWARRNFRLPEERAVGFAYTFLGIRIQCAQCHKHPFDKWSKEDFDQFAVLFSSVQANPNTISRDAKDEREEMMASLITDKSIKGGDLRRKITELVRDGEVVPFPELTVQEGMKVRPDKNAKNKKKPGKISPIASGRILGESTRVTLEKDPRDELMRWLRDPGNPYFAKAIVNRVWSNYFGVGIVDPTDDMNLGNPPSNEPLLNYLASEFVASGFDLKWLHREIMTSDTYQRSSQSNVTNAADKRNFSRHVPRRLPAEVIRDSVYLVTSNDTVAEESRRTLKSLSISGNAGVSLRPNERDFALQVFGQSIRETNCDCDRSDQSNLLQSIYLQNDTDIHRQLGQNNGWIAEKVLEGTGQAFGDRASAKMNGGKEKLGATLVQQLSKRFVAFKAMPENRQDALKPKLKKEVKRINEKLSSMGLEPVTFESLLSSDASDVAAVAPENPNAAKLNDKTLDQWVSESYLRALSRYPDTQERETAMAFIRESRTPGDGLESLMWVLLNTKEFILSH